jgi:hypothetical protein
MFRRNLNSSRGQTSIEYLLLIVVAVSIGLAFMKKMDEYLIQNPDGIIGKPLKDFKSSLNSDTNGRYGRFPLRQ